MTCLLNEIWKKVKRLEKTTTQVNKKFLKIISAGKSKRDVQYFPQLVSKYTIEKLVAGAKEVLVREAISLTLQKSEVKNVDIPNEVEKMFIEKEDFDENIVEQYIRENYVDNADVIAKTQILEKSQKLLHTIWEKGGARKPTLKELVKGRKLRLEVYWSYGSLGSRSQEDVHAIEKLIQIVLFRKEPSKVEVERITYLPCRYEKPNNTKIESFRFYKNGKFEITFTKESYARKVARALIS